MKVIVDLDVCEYHGQCEIAAPDIFQLKDEETLVWNEEPDESQRDDAIAAADVCPTQAIRIED